MNNIILYNDNTNLTFCMQEAEVARSDNCNKVLHNSWLYKVFLSFTPNISMDILHTVLYTFPVVLKNQDFLNAVIISFILVTLISIQG